MNRLSVADPVRQAPERRWAESEGFELLQTVSIRLPPAGSGVRARRRRQEAKRRLLRQTTVVALAVAILTTFSIGISTVRDRSRLGPLAEGPAPTPGTGVRGQAATAALAQRDASGAAVSVTLLVGSTAHQAGHVVLIPPGTMVELPSFGLDTLGRALALGGTALLQTAIENLLGVRLGSLTVTSDAQLAALVAPAGALTVDVPTRVEQVDPAGRVSMLWDAGTTALAPSDLPRFLAARGTGSDLARMARHQAFWTAWLARIRQSPSALAGLPDGLRRIVQSLASAPPSFDTLPVETMDAGSGGDEVYRVRQADLDGLLREVLPGAAVGRLRVQILNGTGTLGLAQRVASRLLPTGARVVVTGNADSFAYPQTQVVFYDRAKQAAAQAVQRALGAGKLVFSRQALDVVDVTIVIGKDFSG